ncbi:ABC transporter substrate-binding protein [Desulforhopalus singaporensis]|uniref:Iron complex transport system substrate-binding protein n=1 Tax=Desulforhopalus singaporensis TaxID=91360 RepID=A0A1H0KL32_9BACT|nr:helical backbone metal receptor [Desulforhopalus singaporensis]SDO56461.1 iron complex transport system substrate-binding protein [Desulforhopalus singaporensis]
MLLLSHMTTGRSRTLIWVTVLLLLSHNTFICLAGSGRQEVPQKIVSLGPINTENVYLLGAGDRLVGTTTYCVRPDAAKSTAKIGSVLQVSVEKIISLQPDLVLATGLTRDSQIELLRKVGLKVVRFDQPSSFASSCEQFEQLGQLLGLEKRAKTITSELRRQIQTIVNRITALGLPSPKVVMQIGADPLYLSGRDSFTNDFIELILAKNVNDTLSGRIGYERVIAADPDLILIAIMGSETGVASKEQEKWNRINVIKAVQDQRIHIVDPNLVCSPSPATFVQALHQIVPLIYPQIPKPGTF